MSCRVPADVCDCVCMRPWRSCCWCFSAQQVARTSSRRKYQGCCQAGNGLIGTIAALVLGLLIASANSTFETEHSQVQQLAADVVFLDGTLAQFGPETNSTRNLMRRVVLSMADRIWRENGLDSGKAEPFEASAVACPYMMRS